MYNVHCSPYKLYNAQCDIKKAKCTLFNGQYIHKFKKYKAQIVMIHKKTPDITGPLSPLNAGPTLLV